jgi:hypothetical protein
MSVAVYCALDHNTNVFVFLIGANHYAIILLIERLEDLNASAFFICFKQTFITKYNLALVFISLILIFFNLLKVFFNHFES